LTDQKNTAVVLLQLGGPDNLDAVEPFLYNLFCDPDIIDIPGAFLFRRPLARLISSLRAPKVKELYKSIGSKSPILEQTTLQADALKKYFRDKQIDLPVYVAMRYWHPMTDIVVEHLIRDGIRKVVLVPLYPHYSRATTGSSVNEWNRVLKQQGVEQQFEYSLVHSYPEHPLYVQALVERINETLERFSVDDLEKVHLVFSAHGTPIKLVKEGDPYSHQIRKTFEAVVKQGKYSQPSTLCFQSKVGPQKWLTPSLTGTVEQLAHEGITHMLVIPIAFVSEHIETLSEINIEARNEALKFGVKVFEMMPALLDHPKFIECLAELTQVRQLE